jgi:hypothetical protein
VTPSRTLLSGHDGIVLAGRWVYLPLPVHFVCFSLPGGLNTRLVGTSSPGGLQKTSYQTGGITWWADYNLIFNEGADTNSGLDLSAWVSIINQSGATYSDTSWLSPATCNVQPTRRWRGVSRSAKAAMEDTASFVQRTSSIPLHARPPTTLLAPPSR